MERTHCPNCESKLKGFLGSNYIINKPATDFINTMHDKGSEAYCSQCAPELLNNATYIIERKRIEARNIVESKLSLVPILTANQVPNWEYEPISIVSSQSVTGTGFMSEISSSWADLMGGQSSALGDKIEHGEKLCKDKLRYKTLMLGGNAIIATDIDYSEVGSGKGMLMVCMAGTAVRVSKWSSNLSHLTTHFEELYAAQRELEKLKELRVPPMTSNK